jgi:hypothetical protein
VAFESGKIDARAIWNPFSIAAANERAGRGRGQARPRRQLCPQQRRIPPAKTALTASSPRLLGTADKPLPRRQMSPASSLNRIPRWAAPAKRRISRPQRSSWRPPMVRGSPARAWLSPVVSVNRRRPPATPQQSGGTATQKGSREGSPSSPAAAAVSPGTSIRAPDRSQSESAILMRSHVNTGPQRP